MRKYLVVLLAISLLAAACGDDDGNSGTTSDGVTIEEIRPVTVTGTALPLFPDGGGDPAVGMAMPEIEGASFDGTPVSITNDGRAKVLLILAHW